MKNSEVAMIDRVTPLKVEIDSKGNEVEQWHICWMYKDSIKTVYCKRCAKKEYNDKRKLATF